MIDLTDKCFLCDRDSNLVVYFTISLQNGKVIVTGLCKNHDYDQVALCHAPGSDREWKRLSRAEVMVFQIMEQ